MSKWIQGDNVTSCSGGDRKLCGLCNVLRHATGIGSQKAPIRAVALTPGVRQANSLFRTFLMIHVLIVGLALVILPGCSHPDSDEDRQLDVLRRTEQFYRAYLNGDQAEARRSLEQAAKLLESSTVLEPSGRAFHLFLTHSRLYALDKRIGDGPRAEAELAEIHYWLVKRLESLGLPAQQVADELREYDVERIMKFVDQTDRKVNSGGVPKYVLDAAGSATDKQKS
jgi:hypothetical protein